MQAEANSEWWLLFLVLLWDYLLPPLLTHFSAFEVLHTGNHSSSTRVKSNIALLEEGQAVPCWSRLPGSRAVPAAPSLEGVIRQKWSALWTIQRDLQLSSSNAGVCYCSGKDVVKKLQPEVRLQVSHLMAEITGMWSAALSATAEKNMLKMWYKCAYVMWRTIRI